MSMYLPNPDLQPTGAELAEFIDIQPTVREPTREADDENDPEPQPGPRVGRAEPGH
jgi:hypothetical protein